jgi:hypothetical protein
MTQRCSCLDKQELSPGLPGPKSLRARLSSPRPDTRLSRHAHWRIEKREAGIILDSEVTWSNDVADDAEFRSDREPNFNPRSGMHQRLSGIKPIMRAQMWVRRVEGREYAKYSVDS